jgi:hypothetical protein
MMVWVIVAAVFPEEPLAEAEEDQTTRQRQRDISTWQCFGGKARAGFPPNQGAFAAA